MNNLLISIIIPTFNRAHLIGETLDSIGNQSYLKWECIVVDDGSIDSTESIVRDYIKIDNRYQYHKLPDHLPRGGNAARNYGYERSQGFYIQWFDDDDMMLPEFLETKLTQFNNYIDVVICSGFYFGGNNASKLINISVKSSLFKDYVLFRSKIFTPSVMFKRTFLEKYSLFKLDILRGQETELFSRMFFDISESQYKIIDVPLFFYRQHVYSKSYKNNEYVKEFKTSEIYVAFENLKRSLLLKDSELIHFFYRVLINFFFRALENKDTKNAKHILYTLTQILKPFNSLLVLQLQLAGHFFITIRRGFYKVEMYFKGYHI